MTTIKSLRRRQADRRRHQDTTEWVVDQRDRGAVLPLVLVMIIVGALIVIPVTTYTTSVIRANRVEEEKTRNVEAAKGAVRVALRQPSVLFGNKDVANAGCPTDASVLIPPGGVSNDASVSLTCAAVSELSANEVFGFEVPVGAAQLQIAPDPSNFSDYSGVLASSGDAPPYPTDGASEPWAWWQPFQWTNTLEPTDVKSIWLPDLPAFSGVDRGSTALPMPGFDCQVFLPGRYPDPLTIDASGPIDKFYFTSGVYYFEEPVTISGDVDVVVGQGLADFGVTNDCADDVQVGANVSVPADTVYGIDGQSGGATWVLGDRARIQISEAGGAPSVRFNQRYAPIDRGGWANIMSVNGDWSYDNGDSADDDEFEGPNGDHSVTNVNWVPRSQAIQLDEADSLITIELGDLGAEFTPSHPDLTDEARLPSSPSAVGGEARVAGADAAVLVTFRGVEGAATNGAIIDRYEAGVQTSGGAASPTATCTTAGTIPNLFPIAEGADGADPWGRSHPENAADPDTYGCVITGLSAGSNWYVTARSHNEAGWSEWTTPTLAAASGGPAAAPGAPSSVVVQPYEDDPSLPDAAIVSWDASATIDGAPITGYDVEVYRVFEVDAATTTTTTTSTTTTTTTTTTTPPTTSTTTTTTTVPPAGSICGPPLDCASIPACPSGEVAAAWYRGGANSGWRWDCEPSCDADELFTYHARNRRCAPTPADLGCDADETPVRDRGSWICTDFDSRNWDIRYRNFDDSRPPAFDCPSGFRPRLGFGTVFCSSAGPLPFRGAPQGAVPSTPMTGTTTTLPVGPALLSVASSPHPSGSPTTSTATTTTIAPVYVEVEELIDLAEAKCSTEPRMEKTAADQGREWTPPPTQCVIPDLPTLSAVGGDGNTTIGYRVKVTARSAVGSSAPATYEPPFMSIPGSAASIDPAPPERVWFPRQSTAIIDIDTSGGGRTVVDIPGYVSVPMGRLRVANGGGDDVSLEGGVVAGKFDISDPRAPRPYGYVPSVIMQRTIELTAAAGNIESKARVKINSDTSYGILRWVTQ